LTPDALPSANLPIYPGLEQALSYVGLQIRDLVHLSMHCTKQIKLKLLTESVAYLR